MKILKFIYIFFVVATIFFYSEKIRAQETDTIQKKNYSFFITGGTMSSFIWRGLVISPTLCFHSMFGYSYKNFTIGTWGGVDILGNFKEIDIIMGYSLKCFSVTVSDYYENQKDYNKANNWRKYVETFQTSRAPYGIQNIIGPCEMLL